MQLVDRSFKEKMQDLYRDFANICIPLGPCSSQVGKEFEHQARKKICTFYFSDVLTRLSLGVTLSWKAEGTVSMQRPYDPTIKCKKGVRCQS